MNNLSRLEAEALASLENARREVLRADKLCAEAGIDGDEVVQPLDEARRLLEHVIKIIQS